MDYRIKTISLELMKLKFRNNDIYRRDLFGIRMSWRNKRYYGREGWLGIFFFFSYLNLENLSGSAHKLQVWHLLCLRLSGNKKRKWRTEPKSRFPAFMPKWF